MATNSASGIEKLPEHILLEIFSYLSVKDRCLSGRVCRLWRKIVQDYSLWRHVDLLPYKLDLRNMWKFIRTHLSDRLLTLRIKGTIKRKSRSVHPPLSASMLAELRTRCPKLTWLHMEPGNITNILSPVLLPTTLTHLTLRRCTWQPRWFRIRDSAEHFYNLIYLDLSDTTRIDNHDLNDIAEFTQLRTLKLDNCYRLSEPGLQEIAQSLTKLTVLCLRNCDTSDLVAHHIGRNMTSLEELDLSGSRSLTESGLISLVEGLLKLKTLALDNCNNFTVNTFCYLIQINSLRKVSMVLDNRISEDSVAGWRIEMPKCAIHV